MFELPETQKAYEFSYAVFRVAALVRRADLKERLERQAAMLLEKVASGDPELRPILETLRALILLSEGVGEVRYVNAKVLLRELENLERMLKDRAHIKKEQEEFDIERMFSAVAAGKTEVEETIRKTQAERAAQKEAVTKSANEFGKLTTGNSARQETRQNGNGETLPSPNGFGGQARAAAIYTRVQKGSAQLKEMLAEFGNVSERTLRYDLQRLVEQGKVERVGSGGPGTYYRIPQA